MRILFANKFFFLNGGSERVFFQERGYLLKQGIKVVDFSMVDSRNFPSRYSSYFVPNIDYDNTKGIFTKLINAIQFVHSYNAIKNLKKLITQEKPDIAHLHNIYHQLTPSIIPLLKKNNIKVVLTLHDGKLICPAYRMLSDDKICVECDGKNFWRPVLDNCQRSRLEGMLLAAEGYWHKWFGSYDYVDKFLIPSNFLAEMVSRRIPKEKIIVLRNGVNVNNYFAHLDHQDYALYFGRISKEKGIETLLKAYTLANFKNKLKIVGTGPLLDELRVQYKNIDFLGYKSGSELKRIVANAAFVVVPSEWYENCSMVILEAMALGKPVIGSRIGGIPEQIDDGKTGFLFEIGNIEELGQKMALLWDDSVKIRRMGTAAREKVEKNYSLDLHCKQLIGIYNSLS